MSSTIATSSLYGRQSTYHCTSSTSSFSASQLCSCKSYPPQIFQHCDLWVRIVKRDLCAVEVEPQGIVKVSCDLVKLTQRICGYCGPRARLDKSGGHVPVSS
jgi:hypothetical protein